MTTDLFDLFISTVHLETVYKEIKIRGIFTQICSALLMFSFQFSQYTSQFPKDREILMIGELFEWQIA